MTQVHGSEVVLITGGSGFLGQHLVRTIQERDPFVKEIRIVDLVPYENKMDHSESKKILSFVGDICDPEAIEMAFKGVDCVFHCAAYINFQFPPNLTELERINVNGTQNVIDLCIKNNVPRLVFASTAAVNMIPYLGSTFTIIINQTESKAKTPTSDSGYLIPGYPASKFRAEKLILAASGTQLNNGKDTLKTVALRTTLMYGEEDNRFFPTLLKIGEQFNHQIPRIGGGGKQQLIYAGNAAWAFVRAKNTLKTDPEKITGLPVFISDDTPIEDTIRFCQRISNATNIIKLRPTWWSLPAFLIYFLAFLLEVIVKIVSPIFGTKLHFPPRGLISYNSSIILLSRLRASIHMDYEPIFNEQKSILNSANWYEKWYTEFVKRRNLNKRVT